MTGSSAQEIFLKALGALRPGIPAIRGSLGILPLTSTLPGPPDGPIPVAEALVLGTVTIREIQSPAVPSLWLTNRDRRAVIVDIGDELVGGQQNRVAAVITIVPPGEEISLPVHCAEQGRWTGPGQEFSAGDLALPSVREAILAHIVAGTRPGAGSAQSAVWDAIAAAQERAGISAPTRAMATQFAARAPWLEEVEGAMPFPEDGTIGAVAVIDGEARCAGLFTRTAAPRHWRRFVRSCAMAAGARRESSAVREPARRLLASAERASCRVVRGPADSEQILLDSRTVIGTALVRDGGILQATIFTRTNRPERTSDSAARAERVRSWRYDRTRDTFVPASQPRHPAPEAEDR